MCNKNELKQYLESHVWGEASFFTDSVISLPSYSAA